MYILLVTGMGLGSEKQLDQWAHSRDTEESAWFRFQHLAELFLCEIQL